VRRFLRDIGIWKLRATRGKIEKQFALVYEKNEGCVELERLVPVAEQLAQTLDMESEKISFSKDFTHECVLKANKKVGRFHDDD